MQGVPFLDLKAQYELIKDEIRQAIERVVQSQQFILGPEVEAFEDEIAVNVLPPKRSRCPFIPN